jgi:hypothetical protein
VDAQQVPRADAPVVESFVGHGDEAGGGRVGDQVAVEVQGAFGVLLRRGRGSRRGPCARTMARAGFLRLPRGGLVSNRQMSRYSHHSAPLQPDTATGRPSSLTNRPPLLYRDLPTV